MEMYGSTESQLQTVNRPGPMHRPGAVGTEVYGTESCLLDKDKVCQAPLASLFTFFLFFGVQIEV